MKEIIRSYVVINKNMSLWLGAVWGELFQPKWRQRECRARWSITICPFRSLILTKRHTCGDRQQQLWKQTEGQTSGHLWRGTTRGRWDGGGAVALVKTFLSFIFCLEVVTCVSVSSSGQKRCVKMTMLVTEGWGEVRIVKQVSSHQRKEERASTQTYQILRKTSVEHQTAVLLRNHMVVSPNCNLWKRIIVTMAYGLLWFQVKAPVVQPHQSPVSVKTQCTFCYPHLHPPFLPPYLPLLNHAELHIPYHQGSTYSPQHQSWGPYTLRYGKLKLLHNYWCFMSGWIGIHEM